MVKINAGANLRIKSNGTLEGTIITAVGDDGTEVEIGVKSFTVSADIDDPNERVTATLVIENADLDIVAKVA